MSNTLFLFFHVDNVHQRLDQDHWRCGCVGLTFIYFMFGYYFDIVVWAISRYAWPFGNRLLSPLLSEFLALRCHRTIPFIGNYVLLSFEACS